MGEITGAFTPTNSAPLPNKPLRDSLGRLLPGYSANPNGRPKTAMFSRAVRELLDANGGLPEGWDAKKLTGAQDLAMRTLDLARSGSAPHLTIIVDRAEGKAPIAPEDREAIMANGQAVDPLMALYGITH